MLSHIRVSMVQQEVKVPRDVKETRSAADNSCLNVAELKSCFTADRNNSNDRSEVFLYMSRVTLALVGSLVQLASLENEDFKVKKACRVQQERLVKK